MTAKQRVHLRNSVIGFALVFSAGWLDMLGVRIAISEGLSYITGRGIGMGEALAAGNLPVFSLFSSMVALFMFGSFVGARVHKRFGLWVGLFLSAAAVAIVAGIAAFAGADSEETRVVCKSLIPFAMGCMNSCTSLAGIGRTTHLSGPATDIGINLANGDFGAALYWALRWLGFIFGAFASALIFEFISDNNLPMYISFLIPTLIIAAQAVFVKFVCDTRCN